MPTEETHSAGREEEVSTYDNSPMKTLLKHITDGSTIADLDPSSCLPLNLVRKNNENAIIKLMNIMTGEVCGNSYLNGFASGSTTSISR